MIFDRKYMTVVSTKNTENTTQMTRGQKNKTQIFKFAKLYVKILGNNSSKNSKLIQTLGINEKVPDSYKCIII